MPSRDRLATSNAERTSIAAGKYVPASLDEHAVMCMLLTVGSRAPFVARVELHAGLVERAEAVRTGGRQIRTARAVADRMLNDRSKRDVRRRAERERNRGMEQPLPLMHREVRVRAARVDVAFPNPLKLTTWKSDTLATASK